MAKNLCFFLNVFFYYRLRQEFGSKQVCDELDQVVVKLGGNLFVKSFKVGYGQDDDFFRMTHRPHVYFPEYSLITGVKKIISHPQSNVLYCINYIQQTSKKLWFLNQDLLFFCLNLQKLNVYLHICPCVQSVVKVQPGGIGVVWFTGNPEVKVANSGIKLLSDVHLLWLKENK